MIVDSWLSSHAQLQTEEYDILIYGLGFETRATKAASLVRAKKIIAMQMPRIDIHAYNRNLKFAHTRGHRIVTNFEALFEGELPKIFRSSLPLRIAIDISSINRILLSRLMLEFAKAGRSRDAVDVLYIPSRFEKPERDFPQIERIGPVSDDYTAFNADPLRPYCAIVGLGFEPGVAMGIINQLEPRVSYCFWGSGVDERFEGEVRNSNFEFEFAGFKTKTVSYPIGDPKSSYFLLENLVFSLSQHMNVILVPMGPKIFAFISALVGITHYGNLSVWRVQHRNSEPRDAKPFHQVVVARLDIGLMNKKFNDGLLIAKSSSELRTIWY